MTVVQQSHNDETVNQQNGFLTGGEILWLILDIAVAAGAFKTLVAAGQVVFLIDMLKGAGSVGPRDLLQTYKIVLS